jgi:DNA polymerase-1
MKLAAFDLESHMIQQGLKAPPPVCGSIAHVSAKRKRKVSALISRGQIRRAVRFLLKGGWHLTGANIAYDMAIIAAYFPDLLELVFKAYDEGRIHDVQIRQALDAIANGHLYKDPRDFGPLRSPDTGKVTNRYSLAICVDLVLGRKDAKKNDDFRVKYATLEHLPTKKWPASARQYPKDDVINTLDVHLEQEAKGFRNLHAESENVAAAFALHLASCWGFRTDPERVAKVVGHVTRIYERDQKRFEAEGLIRAEGAINPETQKPWPKSKVGSRDMAKIKEMVSKAYAGSPPLTDGGDVSTDRDTLMESGNELLEAYAETGGNTKLHDQYLEIIRRGLVLPITPDFNVLVKTTRTSCSNPNAQNFPRGGLIRECIMARPGYVFCSVDYAALEMATLAQTCLRLFGQSDIATAINRGDDLHVALGSECIAMPYGEFLAAHKAGDKFVGNIRQGAKAGNYGFGGGMGPVKFVQTARKDGNTTVGPDGTEYAGTRFCILMKGTRRCGEEFLTEWNHEAIRPTCKACVMAIKEELKPAWLRRWGETGPYFDYVARMTDGSGTRELEIPGTGIVKGGCNYTDGANLGFQGPAAVGAKRALWAVTRECYADRSSPLYGSRPVMFVHDEIIAEMPLEIASEAGYRMAEIMVREMRTVTPDVKIEAEPALMSHLYKGAKTIKDPSGKLLIWQPKEDPFLKLTA